MSGGLGTGSLPDAEVDGLHGIVVTGTFRYSDWIGWVAYTCEGMRRDMESVGFEQDVLGQRGVICDIPFSGA